MPYVIDFDSHHRLLRVTFYGTLDDRTIAKAYDDVSLFTASEGACSGIIDFSPVSEVMVSAEAIRELASRSPAFPTECQRVIIASRDSVFGLTRMFQIHGADTRPNLEIVRSLEDACSILGVPAALFDRVI